MPRKRRWMDPRLSSMSHHKNFSGTPLNTTKLTFATGYRINKYSAKPPIARGTRGFCLRITQYCIRPPPFPLHSPPTPLKRRIPSRPNPSRTEVSRYWFSWPSQLQSRESKRRGEMRDQIFVDKRPISFRVLRPAAVSLPSPFSHSRLQG